VATRALHLHDHRTLIDRVLDDPQLPALVPRLPAHAVHGLIRAVGLEDAGAIVVHATPDQLTTIFDDDLWTGVPHGDRFDPSRFGIWLDVLAAEDPAAAARTLTGLSREFVVGALSHHLLVVERAWVTTGAAFGDPEVSARGRAGLRLLLDQGLTTEFGALLVIGTSRHSWDSVVALLQALHEAHEEAFQQILAGCAKSSFAWLATGHGPSPGDLHLSAMAAARDERRDATGFVTTGDAEAFLDIARSLALDAERCPPRDEITAAYFRDLASHPATRAASDDSTGTGLESEASDGEQPLFDVVLALADPPAAEIRRLLTARELPEPPRFVALAAHLSALHANDPAAYHGGVSEITYLVNIVGAGASFASRRPTPHEAREVVLATCNLGLENWPARWDDAAPPHVRNLVRVFAVGWTVLTERVTLRAARRLRDVLADIRIEDRSLALQLAETRARLERAIVSRRPCQVRTHLDVLSVLDPVTWFVLSALLDECPAVPISLYRAEASSRVLRVTTDLEFFSENAQIAWADAFLESLPDRLIG